MEEKIFDEKGSLLLFRQATEEDMDLMLKLLSSEKYEFISILRYIIGNDEDLLKVLDTLSGAKVVFPERKKIYKTLEKVFIYNYVKSRGFSQQAYVAMAKHYDKRVTQVKAMVDTMNRFLNKNSEENNNVEDDIS